MQNDFKTSGKKRQTPVLLDLGGMLAVLEKQQHALHTKPSSRPVMFSIGAVPFLSKDASSGERGRCSSQVKTPHNPLDSSAPLIKKGKQKEIPKAKKPTSLKEVVLKELQERMQEQLQESAVSLTVANGGQQWPTMTHRMWRVAPVTKAPVRTIPQVQGRQKNRCLLHLWLRVSQKSQLTQSSRGTQKLASATFPKIHSRRFRDYCSQILSKGVDICSCHRSTQGSGALPKPDVPGGSVKANTKRRLVLGLREVLKHLKLRKLKCIIVSPSCEKTQSKGGLDDTLYTIIDCACEQNIPLVFALNRKAQGGV